MQTKKLQSYIIDNFTTGFNCNFSQMYEAYIINSDQRLEKLKNNNRLSKINSNNSQDQKFINYCLLIEKDVRILFEFMKLNGGFNSEISQKEFHKFNNKVCELIRGNNPYEFYYVIKSDGMVCFTPRIPMKGFRNSSKILLNSKNKNNKSTSNLEVLKPKSDFDKFCDIHKPRVILEFIDNLDVKNVDKLINKRLNNMWIAYQNPICIDLD